MLSPAGIFYVYGFWVALPLSVAAARLWGGWAERAVALCYVAAFAATTLVLELHAKPFVSIQLGLVLVDAALIVALAAIAVRSSMAWVIWATSFQIIGTLGHLSKLVRPEMSRLAYGLMEGMSGWPTLIALMIGIWKFRRSRRKADAAHSSRNY